MGPSVYAILPRKPRPPARSGCVGIRFRGILETCQRNRYQMKSRTYHRSSKNCRIGMLTKTYQKPAGVRCQRPPGMAYHVAASIPKRPCQSHSPTVYTDANKPSSKGIEFRIVKADSTT